MIKLQTNNWSLDKDLQVIHADVYMEINGEVIIDEPLCIDIGLPALLRSVTHSVQPDRWTEADRWQLMPFFVCGCGDPDCRAFSFVVEHNGNSMIRLLEVEERRDQNYRIVGEYTIAAIEWAEAVSIIGEYFLDFVSELDYKPYMTSTVAVVREQMNELRKYMR